MGVIKHKVHGIDYAYFRDVHRHETFLGRFDAKDTQRRALVAEREALVRQMKSLQAKLNEVDTSLASYGKTAEIVCRPFVKWEGDKTQLIERMRKFFPERITHYYEPFLGGGAVFFYLASTREAFPAILSDTNHDLINAYEVIRDHVEELIGELTKRKVEFDAQPNRAAKNIYYLKIRESPPNIDSEPIVRAGWFIFLNRMAFSVPFGRYSNLALFDRENLTSISGLLRRKGIEIRWADYREVLKGAKEGECAYLDPPHFSPDNKGFTAYNETVFTKDDRIRFAEMFETLIERKVTVLLSSAKSDFIEAEFRKHRTKDFPFTKLTRAPLRIINWRGSNRTGDQELLVTNQ